MKEAVRSGRRANFFITENSFIDCYASKVGGSGVAVYSILQRCANSETKETWVSAGKMAEVLDMDKSTVYRKLKELEDLRLIKTLRTRDKTIYVVLQVPPPRPEAGPIPLFDAIDFKPSHQDSTWSPVAPAGSSFINANDSYACDDSVAPVQRIVSPVQPISRASANRNKEEQDLLNKTHKQDLPENKTTAENPDINQSARRIITILGLPDTSMSAAIAAVESKRGKTKLSMDGLVQEIVTAANQAERRGTDRYKFLEEFLAQASAQQILADLDLPATNNLIAIVTAAVKAEATYIKSPLEETAALITSAALEDRRRGISIDRFYFENVKWRSNARVSKAEQRKLDNLEVNARVKQRLREKLGTS